jgi:triosephosphate isomerase
VSKLIVGNWKMNGTTDLVDEFSRMMEADNLVLGLPYIFLSSFRSKTGKIKLAAQDCSIFSEYGSYTGEVSAKMLRSIGVEYVILGHSERRALSLLDSAKNVYRKLSNAIEAGLIAILCIDESYDQLIDKNTAKLIEENDEKVILAYEPLSAIGTGVVPDILEIAEQIVDIKERYHGVTTLYGGSVNSKNASEILSIEGIDGVLIGGASLKAAEMNTILSTGL